MASTVLNQLQLTVCTRMYRHAIPDIDLRESLAKRGLECHLLIESRGDVSADPDAPSFASLLCDELAPLMTTAYGRELTPAHVALETWGVTLREIEAPHTVVACSTLQFVPNTPCFFHTHFEAVHPEKQRTGLGRALYDCIAVWTRFLVLNDPIVLHIFLRSQNDYYLVSTIDRDDDPEPVTSGRSLTEAPEFSEDASDNQAGHGAFLKKLGFVRALHDFGQDPDSEIAFQRAFSLPVADWFEAAQQEAEEEQTVPLRRTESLISLSPVGETAA